MLLIALLAGCSASTKQDTTFWYGGVASISITPLTEGLTAEHEFDGAPDVGNLGGCQASMTRQDPRRKGQDTNHYASICASISITGNSCYDEAEIEIVTSSGGDALLFVENAAGYSVETDSLTVDIDVDDFSLEPSGFVSGTANLSGRCYADNVEHRVEVDWAFTETEDIVEGRAGKLFDFQVQ